MPNMKIPKISYWLVPIKHEVIFAVFAYILIGVVFTFGMGFPLIVEGDVSIPAVLVFGPGIVALWPIVFYADLINNLVGIQDVFAIIAIFVSVIILIVRRRSGWK